MTRKDIYHDVVKNALIAEGWIITHDPFHVKFGGAKVWIDLGAEQILGAEKEGQQIAVEIKSFIGLSALSDFHLAIGQFVNYRLILKETYPERTLYLALPEDIYHSLLQTPFGQLAQKEIGLKLIIFNEVQEVITQWIE